MKRFISCLTSIALVFAFALSPAMAADVDINAMKIVLSSQTASQSSGVTYEFNMKINGATSIDANSETIVLTFESAPGNLDSINSANITLKINALDVGGSGGTDQTVSSAAANGEWTISNTATVLTLIAPQDALAAPISLTSGRYIYVAITNLGTPASGDTIVTASGTALGSNIYKGAFLTSDANIITANAIVDPTLSMVLANTTVDLGTLSTGSITESATDPTVTIATNAANGFNISMLDADGNVGLHSSAANHTIAATANSATSAGSEGFDIEVSETADPQTNGSVHPSFQANGGGTITSSALTVANGTGPTEGYKATINMRAAISGITPAASDYTTQLTFIATGSF